MSLGAVSASDAISQDVLSEDNFKIMEGTIPCNDSQNLIKTSDLSEESILEETQNTSLNDENSFNQLQTDINNSTGILEITHDYKSRQILKQDDNMYDLKKVEKKFHEYLKERLNENIYRIDEIKITENLLEKEEAFYIPFGWISYFLVIEDGKPAVYANACSRMDLDIIAFIDEKGYEDYDVWCGENPKMSRKYGIHACKVKRFNYKKDLKFISDIGQ